MRFLLSAIPLLLAGLPFAQADTIAPGTEIPVRTDQPINVSQWDQGRIYSGHVAHDISARDGDVAIPRGAQVEMIVRQSQPGQMTLDLESVTVNGRRYVVDDRASGPEFNTNTNEGLVGSIIGAITGGQTNGTRVQVPGDTVLRFQLQEPLHVVSWQDPGYTRDGNHYHHDHDWYR